MKSFHGHARLRRNFLAQAFSNLVNAHRRVIHNQKFFITIWTRPGGHESEFHLGCDCQFCVTVRAGDVLLGYGYLLLTLVRSRHECSSCVAERIVCIYFGTVGRGKGQSTSDINLSC